jgi:hypothetical protein
LRENPKKEAQLFVFGLPKRRVSYPEILQVERKPKKKKRSFLFLVCRNAAYLIQRYCKLRENPKKEAQHFFFGLPKRRVFYPEILQVERKPLSVETQVKDAS